jgi:AcrR family transcriptional regulator
MAKHIPKDLRIRKIIDVAIKEFIDKGYENTSMESIAKRAELSKGGLYHHFGSKDEIMLEANNRFMEPIIKLIETCKSNTSPAAGLKYYIREYLKYWQKHPRELQFTFLSIFKIMSKKEMWIDMEDYLNFLIDFFDTMLSSAIRLGELKQHNTNSRALALASSLDGVTPYLHLSKKFNSNSIADGLIETYISEIEIKDDE